MGFIKKICQTWIMAVNVLFLLIGIGIMTIGLLLRFYKDVADELINGAKAKVSEIASSGGTSANLDSLDLTQALYDLSLGLIFFGLFLVLVCFLGCCGSCCSLTTCLGFYVVICGFLVVVEIVLAGIIYARPELVQDPTKTSLKDDITAKYQGIQGTNLNSMAWNVIMVKFTCCGVDSYQDFASATWTLKTDNNLVAPLACCTTNPGSTKACAKQATLSVHNEGCYKKLWDLTMGNTKIVATTLGIVGGFQISLLISGAYLLSKSMKKDKKKGRKRGRNNRVGSA